MTNTNSTEDLAEEASSCHCTNGESNAILSSLVERSCLTSEGKQDGVMLTAEGPCVPPSYGSGCLEHDLVHDPRCQIIMGSSMIGGGGGGGAIGFPNDYCARSWCYVDYDNAESCRQSSSDRIYRSTYFPRNEGVDLFYSYTACDPSVDDWTRVQPKHTLEGTPIVAAIPRYMAPFMYKTDDDGGILTSTGSEYYNGSVPYEGVLPDYLNSLSRISKGDLNITYTYGSGASKRVHPTSSFTAAIQDIEDGLVDMAVGPFWITGSRLQMTGFSVPLYFDRTLLVIKNPDTERSMFAQTKKVLDPFAAGVWVLIIALIAVTALLSVWFSSSATLAKGRQGKSFRRSLRLAEEQSKPSKRVYARLALDEFIQKGTFFCSAGVEQDEAASLPQKLLLFGFGFFVLIVVSAYVANLAAFLTRSMPEYIGTMEGVVDTNLKVCAYSALKAELEVAWPEANFVFSQTASDYAGVLQDYDAGLCKVMAIPHTKMSPNVQLMSGLCARGLVFTNSLVIENPVSLPIRPELASGLSFWMYEGEKYHGITLEKSLEEYYSTHKSQPICDVEFSAQEQDEYTEIAVVNLFLPIVFFVSCAALAIFLQLFHQNASKNGRGPSSLVGRRSALSLMAKVKEQPIKKTDSACDDDAEEDFWEPPSTRCISSTGTSLGTGIIPQDTVSDVEQPDDFHENGEEQHSDNEVNGHSSLFSNSGNNATYRLQQLVETGALDEFFSCYKEMKRQKHS